MTASAVIINPWPHRLQCLVLGGANAGKSSILKRYTTGQFAAHTRVPTRGSDFYSHKIRLSELLNKNGDTEDTVNDDDTSAIPGECWLQLWDTPGTERYRQHQPRKWTLSLKTTFFDHADAILLVYDMTSSTSFTQMLQWYAHLPKHLPILVCANKLDLYESKYRGKHRTHTTRPVQQRSVLGLSEFVGQEHQFEYSVSHDNDVTEESTPRDHRQKYKRSEITSFLANRDNWTTDGSYLESLLNSEDESLPDREMVLLWCRRVRLQHFEISAATGHGVDDAMSELVRLAFQYRRHQTAHEAPTKTEVLPKPTEPINLMERYPPKQQECLCFFPLPLWLR